MAWGEAVVHGGHDALGAVGEACALGVIGRRAAVLTHGATEHPAACQSPAVYALTLPHAMDHDGHSEGSCQAQAQAQGRGGGTRTAAARGVSVRERVVCACLRACVCVRVCVWKQNEEE